MTTEVPFYKEFVTWLVAAVASLIALVWGIMNSRHEKHEARIASLDEKIDALAVQKMNRDEFDRKHEALTQKVREDVISLHQKIDNGQKENREFHTKILERLSERQSR